MVLNGAQVFGANSGEWHEWQITFFQVETSHFPLSKFQGASHNTEVVNLSRENNTLQWHRVHKRNSKLCLSRKLRRKTVELILCHFTLLWNNSYTSNTFSASMILLAFRPLIVRKVSACHRHHSPTFPACHEIMGQSPNPIVSSVLVSEDNLRASFAINHILICLPVQ